jgi:hypothetical protein
VDGRCLSAQPWRSLLHCGPDHRRRVDEADRIVAMNVVIDPRRQKLGLVAITTFNVVHATILANQLAKWNLHQPANSRFHTVCLVFERQAKTSDGRGLSNLRRCTYLLASSACRFRNTSSRWGLVKIRIAYPAYSRQERINTNDSENCPAKAIPAAALYAYCDLRNMGPVNVGCASPICILIPVKQSSTR